MPGGTTLGGGGRWEGWTTDLRAGLSEEDLKGSHPVRQSSVVRTRYHKVRRDVCE